MPDAQASQLPFEEPDVLARFIGRPGGTTEHRWFEKDAAFIIEWILAAYSIYREFQFPQIVTYGDFRPFPCRQRQLRPEVLDSAGVVSAIGAVGKCPFQFSLSPVKTQGTAMMSEIAEQYL